MLRDLSHGLASLQTFLQVFSEHEDLVEELGVDWAVLLLDLEVLRDEVVDDTLVLCRLLLLEELDHVQDGLEGVAGPGRVLSLAENVDQNGEKFLCVEHHDPRMNFFRLLQNRLDVNII